MLTLLSKCRLLKCPQGLHLRVLCLVILAVIGMLPIRQTDISGYVLGHMGTLSVSMLFLLSFQVLSTWGIVESCDAAVWRNMNVFWLIIGIVLYPSAIGLFDEDMYRYGFQSTMSWCVLGLSCVSFFCKYRMFAFCLALSVLAHQLQLHESCNLWDYLIDPWLWIVAAIGLISTACRQCFSGHR